MADLELILRGGTVVLPGREEVLDVGISGGRIAALGGLAQSGGEVLDVRGLHILPGAIDPQVHFREPGHPEKEDLESGTRAAVLGGVTAVLEMPNTQPPTTTPELLADKVSRALGRVHCDVGFFVGASPDNATRLADLERLPGCCGVKVFMGSSTGSLLVPDDQTLARVLASGRRRVAVHAEDEERLKERRPVAEAAQSVLAHPDWRDVETAYRATRRIVGLARAAGRPLHVLHVTTAEEAEYLASVPKSAVTFEVPPQHLTLAAPGCYERLGTRAQMNPPIREQRHQDALWRAIDSGAVDLVASDHAPHTLAEKSREYPATPSGMPGVQTILPLMLHHLHHGRLTLQRLVELTSLGPARVWSLANKGPLAVGRDADFSIVDLRARRVVEDRWIASRCGWTPFDGMEVVGWPVMTVIRGVVVMRDDELVSPGRGQLLRYSDVDPQSIRDRELE